MTNHLPGCPAGPYEDGWSPPCVKLTHVPNHDYDYPFCSFCWNREDNCHCMCEWISAGLRAARDAVNQIWVDSVPDAIAAIDALKGKP